MPGTAPTDHGLALRIRTAITVLAVVVAAYFMVFGGRYGMHDLRRVQREKNREQAALDEAHIEIAQLRARIDSIGSDDATLERRARERYGLIRDGEILIRFVTPEEAESVRSPASD